MAGYIEACRKEVDLHQLQFNGRACKGGKAQCQALRISTHQLRQRIRSQLEYSAGPDGAPSRYVGCGGTGLTIKWIYYWKVPTGSFRIIDQPGNGFSLIVCLRRWRRC